MTGKTAYNSGLAKGGVSCSAETFTHCKIVFYRIREPFGVVVKIATFALRQNVMGILGRHSNNDETT